MNRLSWLVRGGCCLFHRGGALPWGKTGPAAGLSTVSSVIGGGFHSPLETVEDRHTVRTGVSPRTWPDKTFLFPQVWKILWTTLKSARQGHGKCVMGEGMKRA